MDAPQFPNIVLYAIPFFALTVLIEGLLIAKHSPNSYKIKDALTSITMGLGNVAIGFLSKIIALIALLFIYQNFRFFTIPISWWSFLLILFADDFSYYWSHRIGHRSRFFWASHVVHHSSQEYNLSTALRQTWTGGFFTFVFYLWMALIGFHPAMILFQMGISLLYQYWIHTELIQKMPKWFEAVFNTPSHHRVHHGNNPLYLDKNHAGIFIIWDRLFGTFQAELEEEKVTYGLTNNISSYNPIIIAFKEWASLLKDVFTSKTSISNRLNYFIKPPGWKHDGTGKLSEDLLQEWDENRKKTRD